MTSWHLYCLANFNQLKAHAMKYPKFKNPRDQVPRRNTKLEAKYANYFKVGHNAFEFILDFGQYSPENEEPEVCTRVIISPGCVKELFIILGESIEQYIENFES